MGEIQIHINKGREGPPRPPARPRRRDWGARPHPRQDRRAQRPVAPGEEEVSDLPDGSVTARFSSDLRSFKRSRANRNLDFNAVRIDGLFFRDDGRFDRAPTREAARRAEASKKAAARQKRL